MREAWLSDSIEKKEAQPLDAYDIVSDLAVGGRGIPLYQQDTNEEALETITAEVFVVYDLFSASFHFDCMACPNSCLNSA